MGYLHFPSTWYLSGLLQLITLVYLFFDVSLGGCVLGSEASGRYSYILTLASLFLSFRYGGFRTFFFGKEHCLLRP